MKRQNAEARRTLSPSDPGKRTILICQSWHPGNLSMVTVCFAVSSIKYFYLMYSELPVEICVETYLSPGAFVFSRSLFIDI